MCCNRIQAGDIYEMEPRCKTRIITKSAGLCVVRELICFLKKCQQCGGARITVFAECTDKKIYFIEKIKSKNIADFLKKNHSMKRFKSFNRIKKSFKSIPLYYFDKGKKLPCMVSFSALKIALYNTDVFEDLRKLKHIKSSFSG